MRFISKCSTPLSAGVLAAFLGGCAVTTIDVDVYKGPLADHELVQLEDLRVLATSAKQALIQLRNPLCQHH